MCQPDLLEDIPWRVPPACWLCIHVTAHSNRLAIFGRAGPYGEDVPHLINLYITAQASAFSYEPVSHFFVLASEREATHASPS
jgi:hypothetical protein